MQNLPNLHMSMYNVTRNKEGDEGKAGEGGGGGERKALEGVKDTKQSLG